MSPELLAILLLVVVHLIAIAVLLLPLLSGEGVRGWWPLDDDGGGDSPGDDGRPHGGPPLLRAEQSSVRLRESGTLADGRRPRRRHAVERDRAPVASRGAAWPVLRGPRS